MKIGILGSGDVAQTLGTGFAGHGHDVMLGTRDPSKLDDWVKATPRARAGSFADAATFAELAVLAVKASAAQEVLRLAGPENLSGKTTIDTTNPIADSPPTNGVLQFTTNINESAMEGFQRTYPSIRFVKAFNSVGSSCMVNPRFAGGKPSMFICGDDISAKKQVTTLLDELGWETEDMGHALAACAIEPLCMLWCIPGFLANDWTHAFKVLR